MASSISCVASGSSHHPHHHHIGQQGGDRSRVIGELSRGRDMAAQLRQVLREIGSLQNPSALDLESSTSSAGHVPAIVAKILDTFTQSISILSSGASQHVDVGSGGYSDDVVTPENGRKLEGSGDSCKTTRKDKRGCHKRKRNTETWTKESSTWPEDRFGWRKYGQKVILHAQHPRNYFRCTHKYDEGCLATKQVQKIQDDPPVFRATYYAHHSCTSATRTSTNSTTSSLGLPYPDPEHHHSSTIWSFHQPTAPAPAPEHAPPVKKGSASSSCPTQTQVQIQSSSSSPNTPNPHHPAAALSDFGSNPRRRALLGHQIQLPHLSTAYSSGGSAGSDHHGDVYSCTASSTRTRIQMEMDMDMDMDMEMTNSMISLDDLLPI